MSLFWELVVRFSVGSGQRRFTRFVALASLLGMMLGVAALITVLSVMNGFSGELHQRLLSVTPDMTVLPPDSSDENLSRWASLAIDQEGVTGSHSISQWHRFAARGHAQPRYPINRCVPGWPVRGA